MTATRLGIFFGLAIGIVALGSLKPGFAIRGATIHAAAPPASVAGACPVSPVVADLDRSLRFYRDLLGLEVTMAPRPIESPGLAGPARSAEFRIPGSRCVLAPIEVVTRARTPPPPRMQDAGALTLILLVRDIDTAFARLSAAKVPVVTTGGAPVAPSPRSRTRAVIVSDPDGHFVELAQLEPPPQTAAPASSNVFDIRFRFTVNDVERSAAFYRSGLGIGLTPGAFERSAGVMAMMGLPEAAEYRLAVTPLPESTLVFELLEIKGLPRAPERPTAQAPGAPRLELQVDDLGAAMAALNTAGAQMLSTVLQLPAGRMAAVQDIDGLVLTLRQAAAASREPGPRSYHVQGNVWVITGAGGNITVQASAAKAAGPGAGEGVLLVDTGRAGLTAAVRAEIERISPGRIEYIINTHADADHVGGNAAFAVPRMDFLWTPGTITGPGVKVLAHENVLPHMANGAAGNPPPYPSIAWPNATYSVAQRKIFFNGEPVVISHVPSARTDGDSIVFFRQSDVISAGDLFLTTGYPVVDRRVGGSLAGIIGGLNQLLDLMVVRYNQEGGTYVIPGHGRVGDQHDVLEYRDMLVIIRDRIQDGVARRLTLDQIKATRPTLDYDARWGAPQGQWTPEKFVEAIYGELTN